MGWGVVDATAAATCETKMKATNPLRRAREGLLLLIASIEERARGPDDSDNEVDFQFYRNPIDIYENVPRVQVTASIV